MLEVRAFFGVDLVPRVRVHLAYDLGLSDAAF